MTNVATTKDNNVKTTRFSGVELLRIIAIFLICLSHAAQTAQGHPNLPNIGAFNKIMLVFLRYAGSFGNITFVICSAYFLLDSTKAKSKKIFTLLLDSMFISISMLIGISLGGV